MDRRIVAGIVMSLALVATAHAQAFDTDQEGWQFTVTPYLFGAGLDGKTGVGTVTTDVDVPLSDLLDHLDAGFMVAATARKHRWIFGLDAMYIKLSNVSSQSVSGPFGVITVEGTVDVAPGEQIYQPTIAYRLFGEDAPVLDFYVAARYTSLETELTLVSTTTIPSFPGGTRTLDGDATWWDPVIGKRVIISLTDKLFGTTVVDVGGFGVGCDVTYQWMVTAGWRFTDHLSTSLGYRYLKQDYDDDLVWNMVMSGFVVGVGFVF